MGAMKMCVGFASLLAATVASAGEAPFAVLEVRPGDGAGPEIAEPLELMIAGRLGARGVAAIGPSEVAARVAARPELAGCTRGACLDELAAFLGAGRLVGGTVRREGSGYAVELWVYDPDAHESLGGRAVCERCNAEAAPELAARAREDALERDERRRVPATLEVRSEPEGATVRLDGRPVGVTPLVVRVPAGAHGLVIERRGFASQARDVRPEGGQSLDLRFALEAVAAAPARRWSPMWKWAALSASVVAIAAGAALLAVDGNEIDRSTDVSIERRESTAEGFVTLGFGGALAATGVTLWILEAP